MICWGKNYENFFCSFEQVLKQTNMFNIAVNRSLAYHKELLVSLNEKCSRVSSGGLDDALPVNCQTSGSSVVEKLGQKKTNGRGVKILEKKGNKKKLCKFHIFSGSVFLHLWTFAKTLK